MRLANSESLHQRPECGFGNVCFGLPKSVNLTAPPGAPECDRSCRPAAIVVPAELAATFQLGIIQAFEGADRAIVRFPAHVPDKRDRRVPRRSGRQDEGTWPSAVYGRSTPQPGAAGLQGSGTTDVAHAPSDVILPTQTQPILF